MEGLNRRAPAIPKTLFYRNFNWSYKKLHAHIAIETVMSGPSISMSIVLPHQLSIYNSSSFNYETGIYASLFFINFRFQVNWM
jgi:hypothetical protein